MTLRSTDLTNPALRALLDHWLSACEGGEPPRASAISPVGLRPWKDHLVIFEVVAEDAYVYVYYGAALAKAFGESKLGATLESLPERQRFILANEYAHVIAERLPAARRYTALFDGRNRTYERLALPLRGDDGRIDKLLVAAYEAEPATTAIPAPSASSPAPVASPPTLSAGSAPSPTNLLQRATEEASR